MKKVSLTQRGLAFLGASFVGLGLLASGMAYAANATENAAAGVPKFAHLDAGTERILNKVVELGAEMANVLSPKNQLLVLVTADSIPSFQISSIKLQIDKNTASFHQYTDIELTALQQGGSHRLFRDNLPAGRHQLTVSMVGRAPKTPDLQRESTLTIVSGTGRRVVELRIVPGKDQALPEMSLREWK